MKVRNLFIFSVLLLSLTGCFEVEDKGSKDVTAAIEQQNQILQEQNQNVPQKPTVSLNAAVESLPTEAKVNNATATLIIGGVTFATVDITDGNLKIEGVAPNSDYELVIRSKVSAFMDRVFYGRSRNNIAQNTAFENLGKLVVAPGVEYSFAVFDLTSGEPISTLKFAGSSSAYMSEGLRVTSNNDYLHKATYDATVNRYKVTLPEGMSIAVAAPLDIDGDGARDYLPQYNGNNYYDEADKITVSSYVLASVGDNFFLTDNRINGDGTAENVEVRVSVLDDKLNAIPNLTLSIIDPLNGIINSTYDSVKKQYVLQAIIKGGFDIKLPAFTYLDKNYYSTSVQVFKLGNGLFSVNSRQQTFANDAPRVINAVVSPQVNNSSGFSNIYIERMTSEITAANPELKAFYSAPVQLLPNSVVLFRDGVIKVTPGDESDTDFVLSGSTRIEFIDEPVPVTTTLDLGDTLLSVVPQVSLASGFNYQYRLDDVIEKSTGRLVNLSTSQVSFSVPYVGTFDINDIKLDNINYYTSGVLTKPQNTAGQAASVSNFGNSVYLLVPESVRSLRNLTLSKQQVTSNGVARTSSGSNYTVVQNGYISNSKSYVYPMAQNESVVGGSYYVTSSAAVTAGYWYQIYVGDYLQDSTGSSQNSITFSYAYETNAGEQATGVITLPVL